MSNAPETPLAPAQRSVVDGHAELARLAGDLREATLDVVWRQWRVLGAGAAARPGGSGSRDARGARDLHTLVDPEALVLVSLALLDDERRLADLLHDWVARNADLLSVQRMKNLVADRPEPVTDVLTRRLAWFATVARDLGKDLRWRSVIPTEPTGAPPDVHVRDGGTSRATRARLTASTALLLRLRLGVGVGVKADLLAFLLARTDGWATIREMAAATAYTPAAVRRAAEDLAAARLIHAQDGPPARYRAEHTAWAPLLALPEGPPRWGSWHPRFVFVTAFLHWAEAARARPLSAYALGVQGRALLERHRSAFEPDGIAVWSDHSPIHDWVAYLDHAVHALTRWMREVA